MKALPFVVAPAEQKTRRCGTPATGILEFPIYGGITVGEAAYISELLANEQSTFVEGARLADAIAKAEDITISEAFNIIEQSVRGTELEPNAEAIRVRHADRIEQVAQLYANSGKRNMRATVTAIIRCRLRMDDWSMNDTATLLQPLFDEIWALAEDEMNAEIKPASEPPNDELLGKPPEESGLPPKRTGRRSRGT